MIPKSIKDRNIGNIWFSPLGVYKHIVRLSKKVGPEAIEKEGKLKPVREARISAITALAMFMLSNDNPAYVQLCSKEDSPFDSFICQRSIEKKGQLLISNVQITSYREGAKESFLAQLQRTKVPPEYLKYPEKCVVVVDLLTKKPLGDEEKTGVSKYLNDHNTPFPVWSFRAITITPDTIGEMVIFNPNLRVFESINFGKAAAKYKELGLADAVRIEWVPDESKLKEDEHSGVYDMPPWDPEIENL